MKINPVTLVIISAIVLPFIGALTGTAIASTQPRVKK